MTPPPAPASPRPVAAAIAVVIRGDAVLLVRRANPPDAGRWGFPGGKIEPGETLPEAALRELREETGVTAQALRVITALDAFGDEPDIAHRRHFILIAMLCRWRAGEPVAADDALEAAWFPLADLVGASDLPLSRNVVAVAREADALLGGRPLPVSALPTP
ncbi:MAG: NUDIX hydrolase [Acuticoccus sp.]